MFTMILIALIALVVVRLLVKKQQPARNIRIVPYVASARKGTFKEGAADRSRHYW
jgi:hypothetical protein